MLKNITNTNKKRKSLLSDLNTGLHKQEASYLIQGKGPCKIVKGNGSQSFIKEFKDQSSYNENSKLSIGSKKKKQEENGQEMTLLMALGNLSQDDNWNNIEHLKEKQSKDEGEFLYEQIIDKRNQSGDNFLLNDLAIKSNDQSDRSTGGIVEKKLREENMLLRQEILQLKRALYMNATSNEQNGTELLDENKNFEIFPQIITQESPIMNQGKSQTNDDIEYMEPLQIAPQPCISKPLKPTSSLLYSNSNKCLLTHALQQTSQNEANAIMNTEPGIRETSPDAKKEEIDEDQNQLYSVETKQFRADKIQMIEKSVEGLKLRDKEFHQLNKSSSRVVLEESPCKNKDLNFGHTFNQIQNQISSFSTNQQDNIGASSEMPAMVSAQNIYDGPFHQFATEVEEKSEEGSTSEDKKRNSSVFEQKQYYENQLFMLKKELDFILQEEDNLRVQLQKKRASITNENQVSKEEFELQQKLRIEKVKELLHKQQNLQELSSQEAFDKFMENKQASHEKNSGKTKSLTSSSQTFLDQIKKYHGIQTKQLLKNSQHVRTKSNDQIQKEQIQFKIQQKWQPPSFCPSHYNSLNSSPKNEDQTNFKLKEVVTELKGKQNNSQGIESLKNSNREQELCGSEDLNFRNTDKIKENESTIQGEPQKLLGISDVDFIEHIFKEGGQVQQFKCLDQLSNLHDYGNTLNSNDEQMYAQLQLNSNGFMLFKSGNMTDQSLVQHDSQTPSQNSMCQQINQSDSIAIIRVNQDLKNEHYKQFEETNDVQQSYQSLSGIIYLGSNEKGSSINKIVYLSPYENKKQGDQINSDFKDQSPSFGGAIHERNPSSIMNSNKQQHNSSIQVQSQQKHYKKQSHSQFSSKEKNNLKKNSIFSFGDFYQNQHSQNLMYLQESVHKNAQPVQKQSASQLLFENYQKKQSMQKIMKGALSNKRKQRSTEKMNIEMINRQKYETFQINKDNSDKNYDTLKAKKHGNRQSNPLKDSQSIIPSKSQKCMDFPLQIKNNCSQTHQKKQEASLQVQYRPTSSNGQYQQIQKGQWPEQYLNDPDKGSKVFSFPQTSFTPLNQEHFNSQSCMIDAEFLYDMRAKSAIKRREELNKKKQEQQRKKLDKKLEKIQELQRRKDEKYRQISDKRHSKSPKKNDRDGDKYYMSETTHYQPEYGSLSGKSFLDKESLSQYEQDYNNTQHFNSIQPNSYPRQKSQNSIHYNKGNNISQKMLNIPLQQEAYQKSRSFMRFDLSSNSQNSLKQSQSFISSKDIAIKDKGQCHQKQPTVIKEYGKIQLKKNYFSMKDDQSCKATKHWNAKICAKSDKNTLEPISESNYHYHQSQKPKIENGI